MICSSHAIARRRLAVGALAAAIVAAVCGTSFATTLVTLHTFNGGDGWCPEGAMCVDSQGNVYGTTQAGGTVLGGYGNGAGVVYKVDATTHAVSTVAKFNGTSNGGQGQSGVVVDAAGNLYGATAQGGPSNAGTLYKISAGTSTITTLGTFNGGNGTHPYGALLLDAAGNLYGTTYTGGLSNVGTVYELPAGTGAPIALANFAGGNGANPWAGLMMDAQGDLFGSTGAGGLNNAGVVYEVVAGTHELRTIATFTGGNGSSPMGALVADAKGNLYGTAPGGGKNGAGTIFKIAAGTNQISTLVDFTGGGPWGGLLMDGKGDLYGTTWGGGSNGVGTLFMFDPSTNQLNTLLNFNGGNGSNPPITLVADAVGDIFGTTEYTSSYGNGYGTVFEVTGSGFVPVPEPASLGLLGVATLGLLGRRRVARK